MLWLLSLDALAVLLQVHVGATNKLPLRLRGGATTSQAILLTSGSLVTLSGAKVVVEGQKKSSEQARVLARPTACALAPPGRTQPTCTIVPHPRAAGSPVEAPSYTTPRRCIAGTRGRDVAWARAARLGRLHVLLAGNRLRDDLLPPEHAADRYVALGQPVGSCPWLVSARLALALAPTIWVALHVCGICAALGRLCASCIRPGRAARATSLQPPRYAALGTAANRAASTDQATQSVNCSASHRSPPLPIPPAPHSINCIINCCL